jgi:hypothetical protein
MTPSRSRAGDPKAEPRSEAAAGSGHPRQPCVTERTRGGWHPPYLLLRRLRQATPFRGAAAPAARDRKHEAADAAQPPMRGYKRKAHSCGRATLAALPRFEG